MAIQNDPRSAQISSLPPRDPVAEAPPPKAKEASKAKEAGQTKGAAATKGAAEARPLDVAERVTTADVGARSEAATSTPPPVPTGETAAAFAALAQSMGEVQADVSLAKRGELDLSQLEGSTPAIADEGTLAEVRARVLRDEGADAGNAPDAALFTALDEVQTNRAENARAALKDEQKTALKKLATGLGEVMTETLPQSTLKAGEKPQALVVQAPNPLPKALGKLGIQAGQLLAGEPSSHTTTVVMPDAAFVKMEGLMASTLGEFAGMDVELLAQLVMFEIAREAGTDLRDLIAEVKENNKRKQAAREYQNRMKEEKARLEGQIREEYDERTRLPKDNADYLDPALMSFEDYKRKRELDGSFASPGEDTSKPPSLRLGAKMPSVPKASEVGGTDEEDDLELSEASPEAQALVKAHGDGSPPLSVTQAEELVTLGKELKLDDESMYKLYSVYLDSKSLGESKYAVAEDMSFEQFLTGDVEPALNIDAGDPSQILTDRLSAIKAVDQTALEKAKELIMDVTTLQYLEKMSEGATGAALETAEKKLQELSDAANPETRKLIQAEWTAQQKEFQNRLEAQLEGMLARVQRSNIEDRVRELDTAVLGFQALQFVHDPKDHDDDWRYYGVFTPTWSESITGPSNVVPSPLGSLIYGALTRHLYEGAKPPDKDDAILQRMKDPTDPLGGLKFYYGMIDRSGLSTTHHAQVFQSQEKYDEKYGADGKHASIVAPNGPGSWGRTTSKLNRLADELATELEERAHATIPAAQNQDGKPLFSLESYQLTARPPESPKAQSSEPAPKPTSKPAEKTSTRGEAEETASHLTVAELDVQIEKWGNYKDSLSELGDELQLKLQMYTDRRSKAFSTLSNLLKSWSDTRAGIVGNLK